MISFFSTIVVCFCLGSLFSRNLAVPSVNYPFFEWCDDCPPCRDSIRGPRLHGGGSWHEEEDDGFGLGHPDADDFVHY